MQPEQLYKIVSDCSGKPIEEIGLSSRFDEDLGMDSLEMIDMMFHVEDKMDCPDMFADERDVPPTVGELYERCVSWKTLSTGSTS